MVLKLAYQSKQDVIISYDMKKGLMWLDRFLINYSGVSCIPDNIGSQPIEIFSSDSCFTGCRACSSTHLFHFKLPKAIIQQGRYINQFELYAILIAVKEWAPNYQNKNILVYCDSQTSLQVLCHRCVECTLMQKCLREIRYHSAKFNFRIRAVYFKGVQNRISDSLSRWYLSQSHIDIFTKSTKDLSLPKRIISNFEVADYW